MSGMDGLTELLPCPFCGGEAIASADEWQSGSFRCGCKTIGCKGWGERPETKSAAIAAWNRRASQWDLCDNCMGTGVAGHPDSGKACDCDGGMVLAHRRASQAAPAPSDHAISKEWAERMLPLDEGVTPSAGAPAPSVIFEVLAAAHRRDAITYDRLPGIARAISAALTPAPSDGLREALGTLLVQANGVEPRDAMLRQNVIRIALSALTPAPAQEGGE